MENLGELSYISPSDLPNIDLYMDQVTTFMDEHLEGFKRFPDDKILTKTMINNYTKNNLLPPPVKKKYSKDHIFLLIFIYYYKNFLSINDIQKLLAPLIEGHYGDNKRSDISLEDIYEEIFKTQKLQFVSTLKDLKAKTTVANESFQNAKKSEKDFLTTFSLISMLSFDVYLKKQIIEKLIDDSTDEKK